MFPCNLKGGEGRDLTPRPLYGTFLNAFYRPFNRVTPQKVVM